MSIDTVLDAVMSNDSLINKTYDDVIHPAAKNIGTAAGTLTSTLNVLLAPITWAVYGFDIIDKKVKSKMLDKLSNVPLENLSSPEPNIVIPAYEALRYSLDKEILKDMYVNLITSSMINDVKEDAHPAFVEVIKQLSPFDAELFKSIFYNNNFQTPKIKVRLQVSESDSIGVDAFRVILPPKYFTDFSLIENYSFSLDNLERLKLIKILDDYWLNEPDIYTDIIDSIDKDSLSKFRGELPYVNLIKGSIELTQFGKQFISIVF